MVTKPRAPVPVADPAVEETPLGLRFRLHDVEPASSRLPTIKAHEALSRLAGSRVESCSSYHLDVVQGVYAQPLILAAYRAYAEHHALVISPDAVWLTILQGFAHYINADPERHREKLVSHRGKEELTLEVAAYAPGSPENDWARIFERFARALDADARGSLYTWAVADFSTTGPVERAAFQLALLDVLEPYYSYGISCVCGIPGIELRGTVDDWRSLERRIDLLDRFGLSGWTRALRPILRQLTAAAEGRIDLDYWGRIIKQEETYGGELLDGWLLDLIPFLRSEGEGLTANPLLCQPRDRAATWGQGIGSLGVSPGDLPKGLSRVPFSVRYQERSWNMEMVAGLVGVSQNEDGALEARIGWGVRRL